MQKPQAHTFCSVSHANHFKSWFRRLFQNPRRILTGLIEPGMTVMDIGCGPGYFTLPLAEMVGAEGHVIAADVQPEMLEMVSEQLRGSPFKDRVLLHACEQDAIGFPDKLDFVLAFYMVHETPDRPRFLAELYGALKPGGRLFLAEPWGHVSTKQYQATLQEAIAAGFTILEHRRLLITHAAILVRDDGDDRS
jgi:ubiquinone/menaquinone biosynthesis C-methylase UbiE